MKKALLVFCFAFLVSCSDSKVSNKSQVQPTLGADSSGGADHHSPFDGTVWFRKTDRPIQVCFEALPDYSLSPARLTELIEKGFSTWKRYYESKVGNHESYTHPFGPLNFDAQVSQALEGECESLKPDLTFYFGVENDLVRRTKRAASYAYVYKTYQDIEQAQWNRGFIWISALAKDEDANFGLILHELGHVYGCDHAANTIMDAKIVDKMLIEPTENASPELRRMMKEARKTLLTKIDQGHELTLGNKLDYEYAGSGVVGGRPHSGVTHLFEKIFGRPIAGKLVLDLNQKAGPREKIYLKLGDEQEIRSFEFDLVTRMVFPTEARAFRYVEMRPEAVSGMSNRGFDAGRGYIIDAELIVEGSTSKQSYKIELKWNTKGQYIFPYEPHPLEVTISGDSSANFYMQRKDWI